jgi:hypothetical protein
MIGTEPILGVAGVSWLELRVLDSGESGLVHDDEESSFRGQYLVSVSKNKLFHAVKYAKCARVPSTIRKIDPTLLPQLSFREPKTCAVFTMYTCHKRVILSLPLPLL